jgi:hypothetical protein
MPYLTKEEVEKEFYNSFVRMGFLNDMYNRPILYEACFDDINEIKSYIHSLRAKDLEAVVELVEGSKEPNAEVSEYYSGYNTALADLKEKIKKL